MLTPFSMITFVPRLVGVSAAPSEVGKVPQSWPSDMTVTLWVALSTVRMFAAPVVKSSVRSLANTRPVPADRPLTGRFRWICAWPGQYTGSR